MEDVGALVASKLFQGLSPSRCAPFLPIGRLERVDRGGSIFRLGESADRLFIVRSGIVHLTMPIAMNGKERDIVVEEAREGETIGWSALIEPHRFTMAASAATDVELIAFSTRDLQFAVEGCPDAGLRVMENLAGVIARRFQVMHTMWMRELQRAVSQSFG